MSSESIESAIAMNSRKTGKVKCCGREPLLNERTTSHQRNAIISKKVMQAVIVAAIWNIVENVCMISTESESWKVYPVKRITTHERRKIPLMV